MNKLILILITFALCFFTSCQKPPQPQSALKTPNNKTEPKNRGITENLKLSVMAFNLENLFDDVSNNGERPVPADVLDKKLSQLARAILQVNNNGPDILFVSEVENLSVLNALNSRYLKEAQYQTIILIESNDERGIDVGLLSRLPQLGDAVLHRMPFEDINPTRGILEATLELANGKTITVFSNHFPSQSNPTSQRIQAAELLLNLMNSAQSDYAIAGGDFNISVREEIQNRIFSGLLQNLDISHLKGCTSCKGTHYFKGNWSFLDAILVREKDILIPESVQTPDKAKGQLNSDKTPQRFNKSTGEGVSDHLPIYTELIIK